MSITPLYAGLLAILFLVLSIRVIQKRTHVSLGDGGDPELLRRIRGHGNFAEYVPLMLLMMALLEVGAATPAWLLHTLGVTLVIARVLHGIALSFTAKWKFGRFYGTLLSFIVLLVLALLCVWCGAAALLV